MADDQDDENDNDAVSNRGPKVVSGDLVSADNSKLGSIQGAATNWPFLLLSSLYYFKKTETEKVVQFSEKMGREGGGGDSGMIWRV